MRIKNIDVKSIKNKKNDTSNEPTYKLEPKNNGLETSQVNFFIGANNNGKSKFLRGLYSKNYNFLAHKFNGDLYQAVKSFESICKDFSLKDIVEFENIAIPTVNEEFLDGTDDYIMDMSTNDTGYIFKARLFNDLKQPSFDKGRIVEFRTKNPLQGLGGVIEKRILELFPLEENMFWGDLQNIKKDFSSSVFKFMYIPILRGMRPLKNIDPYLERTKNDYFKHVVTGYENIEREIFTGYDIFKLVKEKLLGKKHDRDLIKLYEKFLEDEIFNQPVTLIPEEEKDVLLISIGDEEFPLYQLGDGIQAIILLTFPIYLNKDKNVIFLIEEPEINMHPGLQHKFFKVLNTKEITSKHQFFITTHSNHFLEYVFEKEDVSIFSFTKDKKSNNENVTINIHTVEGADVKLLNNLGVNNTSVFMANCSIWVEGITDRLYIKKYLELYTEQNIDFRKYKEGQHYSFVEYGGSNIVHWDFDTSESDVENIKAKFISNKILLICDSDFDKEGGISENKQLRFQKLEKQLGDYFYRIPCKEIENTLTLKIVKDAVNDNRKNKGKFNNSVKWDTKKNIALWIEESFNLKGTYVSGNTIKNKTAFCRKAIEQMNSYNDLSVLAQDLIKKVVSFIQESNKTV